MDRFELKGLWYTKSVCGISRYGNVFVVTDADYTREGVSG